MFRYCTLPSYEGDFEIDRAFSAFASFYLGEEDHPSRPIVLVDQGSGDCKKLSEYSNRADVVYPFEPDQGNCRRARENIDEMRRNGKEVKLLDVERNLLPTDIGDMLSIVGEGCASIITNCGGTQTCLLKNISKTLALGGYFVKSDFNPIVEALRVLYEVRPDGFEKETARAERMLRGIDSYIEEARGVGFGIWDALPLSGTEIWLNQETLVETLRKPSVWGKNFEHEKHLGLLAKLYEELEKSTHGGETFYKGTPQGVLIVARKMTQA